MCWYVLLRGQHSSSKGLKMPAKLDRCVLKVNKSLADKYVKKNGKQPGKQKKAQIKNSAFAICTAEGREKGWI